MDRALGDGSMGRNRVRKILGNKVVLEEFDGRPGADLQGMSVSVFDESNDGWRQTWVDDHGGYLHLEGAFRDGEMTLFATRGSEKLRMRFFDIAADSFEWRWDRSLDDGASWETRWAISYERELGG